MAAAAEATALQRKLAQEANDKMFDLIKAKGVQIDKVDQVPFMKATTPVIAKWESGPIGPFVKQVVAAARAK
jgi:TRAP-type C4-dicarboxylate transport system substrate-binding protein